MLTKTMRNCVYVTVALVDYNRKRYSPRQVVVDYRASTDCNDNPDLNSLCHCLMKELTQNNRAVVAVKQDDDDIKRLYIYKLFFCHFLDTDHRYVDVYFRLDSDQIRHDIKHTTHIKKDDPDTATLAGLLRNYMKNNPIVIKAQELLHTKVKV